MSKVFRLSVIGAALLCMVLVTSAQAATYVVGSPLTAEFKTGLETSGLFSTVANTALSEQGANLTSPVSGTVVRWRTKGSFAGGGFRLRVMRPAGGGTFIGAGASTFQTPVGTSTQVFPTNLPIRAGDLIGLDAEHEAARYSAEVMAQNTYTVWSPLLPEGSSSTPVASNPGELGFDAEVVPPPTLIVVGPSVGSLAGGTVVTIAGRELGGATAVKFGPNAASANYTVLSEDQITAVVPPAAQPGTVDVTVTTPGGTTAIVSGDQFTYVAPPSVALPESCTVPNLIGKTLKGARKRLAKTKCKLGRTR